MSCCHPSNTSNASPSYTPHPVLLPSSTSNLLHINHTHNQSLPPPPTHTHTTISPYPPTHTQLCCTPHKRASSPPPSHTSIPHNPNPPTHLHLHKHTHTHTYTQTYTHLCCALFRRTYSPLLTTETLLKRVTRQMPFMCFVRYIST
jgi:hypothetical protein